MDFTKDIYINKDKICEDQEFVLLYKGQLFSNDLSKDVYISYGYGNNWDNKEEIPMKPSTFGYLSTIKVGSGNELQFVFRDNDGNYDNNSGQNYKIPVCESEEVLAFKPVLESAKEVNVEVVSETDNNEEDFAQIFEPEIIEINEVDLYKTVDLEETAKQSIPDNTVYTRVNLDNEEVTNEVVQTPAKEVKVDFGFTEVSEKPDVAAVAFAEDGTINSSKEETAQVVKDVPKKVESAEKEKALVSVPDNSLANHLYLEVYLEQ